MRLTILIDAMPHQIDSTDPELIGKWLAEIFGRAAAWGITPATQIEAQVYPSWVPADNPDGSKPDWIADTRIIGRTYQVQSPRDVVTMLARQLDEAEGEHAIH